MYSTRPRFFERALAVVAGVLVLKVTGSVISQYGYYFPANFTSDFLRGREGYFFGSYQWAFYTHIVSGPISLVLGLVLVSDRFRRRFPRWHRGLGRVQLGCVLGLVTPSGLVMAYRAAAGPVAAVGLATLAVATALCVSVGVRMAVRRRFAEHRRWMWRSYLLLCSAVVLRLAGGLAGVVGVTSAWFDPVATWMCWLVPLVAFEVRERTRGTGGRAHAEARSRGERDGGKETRIWRFGRATAK